MPFSLSSLLSHVTIMGAEATSVAPSIARETVRVEPTSVSTCDGMKCTRAAPWDCGVVPPVGGGAADGESGGAVAGSVPADCSTAGLARAAAGAGAMAAGPEGEAAGLPAAWPRLGFGSGGFVRQFHGQLVAGGDRPEVVGADLGPADDVGNQHDHQLIAVVVDAASREQFAQQRNIAQGPGCR